MKAILQVRSTVANKLELLCRKPDSDCGKGEVLFDREVKFPNGFRMAIQVIASESPATESAWTQGVLFDQKGNEIGCTDVGESFLGEYTVEDYTTEVVSILYA